MPNSKSQSVLVTGLGAVSGLGQGKAAFTDGLLNARHNFGVMQRPGRQVGSLSDSGELLTAFLGSEIAGLELPDSIPASLLRTTTLSAKAALVAVHEAWNEAGLDALDSQRVGLVIGGSNVQQREQVVVHAKYQQRVHFLRPTYGMSFMDTDICGLLTEVFDIKGLAYSVGGASASGQVAVIQAIQAVLSGQVDACIAVGALMDLSYWECQGFRSLGAMGSERYAEQPELACRPFDRDRDGFIYGEACGAVVIERADKANLRDIAPYAEIAGWAMEMDANRNPNPSLTGETGVINKALRLAQIPAQQIDYINPHGTGSTIGDETELQALHDCGLSHAYINATKSIVGHGLSAAGAIELIATLLQMREGRLHPTRNLQHPIDSSFNWVRQESIDQSIQYALNLSMGFGGVNTAVCLQHTDTK